MELRTTGTQGQGFKPCFLPDSVLTSLLLCLCDLGAQHSGWDEHPGEAKAEAAAAWHSAWSVLSLVLSPRGGKREFKMQECCVVLFGWSPREVCVCARVHTHKFRGQPWVISSGF